MKRILTAVALALLLLSLCGCVATLTDRTELVGNKTYNERLDTFEEQGGSVVVYKARFNEGMIPENGKIEKVIDNVKSTMRINLEGVGYPDAIVDAGDVVNGEFFITVKIPGLDSSLYDGTLKREYIFGTVEQDNGLGFSRMSLSGKADQLTRYNKFEFDGGCKVVYILDSVVDESEKDDVLANIRWSLIDLLAELGYSDAVVDIAENGKINVYIANVSESYYKEDLLYKVDLSGKVDQVVWFESAVNGLSRNERKDSLEENGGSIATYKINDVDEAFLGKTAYAVLMNLKGMGYENAYVDTASDGTITVTIPTLDMSMYDSIIYRSDLFGDINSSVSRISLNGRTSAEQRTAQFEEKGGSIASYKTEFAYASEEEKKNIRLNTKNIIVKNLADMGYEGSVVALFDDGTLTIKIPEVREKDFDSTINSQDLFKDVPVNFTRLVVSDQLSAEEVKEREKGFTGAFAEILGKEKEDIADYDYRDVRILKLYNQDGRIYVMAGDYSVASRYTSYVRKVMGNPARESASELNGIMSSCKTSSFLRIDGFVLSELDKFVNLEVLLLDGIPFEAVDIAKLTSLKCGRFANCGLTNTGVKNFEKLNFYSVVYLDFTGNNITDWTRFESIDEKVITGKKNGKYVLLEEYLKELEEAKQQEPQPEAPVVTPSAPTTPPAPVTPKAYGRFNFGMTKEQATAVISGPSYTHSSTIYLEDYTASYSNEDSAITGNQNCSYIELIFNESGLYEVRVSGDYVSTWSNADMMFSTIERYYGVRRSFGGELGSSTWNVVKSGVNVTVTAKIEYYEGSGYVVGLVIRKR